MDGSDRRRKRDPPNVIRVEPSVSTSLTKKIRQGDGIDVDWLQKATEKEIMRQDSDGSTPLHALLEINKKLDEPSIVDGIQVLLSKGAKIGVKDGRGRTPLHVATEHGAPASALSLLAQNSSDANAVDDDSMTPLHLLFLGDDPVDPDCVRVLLKSGGDLECRENVQKSSIQPLYLLCERNDASQLLAAIRDECPDILTRHKVPLLKYATAKGTANALEAVLTEIKDDVSDTKLLDHLLLEATGSDRQPIEKGEILVSHGADLNRLPSLGGCTVFHVAANRGLPVLIQLALKRGMKYDLVDEDGNTPIHYAAECGTGGAECIQLLVDSGGDVNARNKFGRTPIFSAVASENLAAVVELIKCGSRLPSLSIARKCGPRQVGILADIQIVESAYNPLQTALKIGGFFKKCAKVNIGYNDQYNQWAAAMETVATEMLDCNQSDGISELLSYPIIYCAVENRQKQFIAHGVVQNHLLRIWNGPRQYHGFSFLRYYFTLLLYHLAKIIIYPGLLLFYYLPLYRRHARFYACRFLYSTPPSVRYGVAALCNIGFAVTLFVESVQGAGVRSKAQLDSIEIIVLIYTIGYILHEARELTRQSIKLYFISWTNIIDIIVLLMFTAYFILRFIDMASEGLSQSDSELDTNRARELIIALATLVVFLRVLDFLKAFPGIGPIQASFGQITHDTFSFLIILVVFGIAFATTISEVYAAGRFSPEYQKVLEGCRDNFLEQERNRSAGPSGLPPPTVIADYGDDYLYDYVFACVEQEFREGKAERSVPEAVDGVPASLVSLVWATFGMVSPDDFEGQQQIETVIGKTLLGLWLVASVVVLINMLIAIITTSFQTVQDNADLEFKFVRASVIHDLEISPTVPPPLNSLYAIANVITYISGEISNQSGGNLKCTSSAAAKMLLNYRNKEAELQEMKSATKADIKQLERKLDLIVQQSAQKDTQGCQVTAQTWEEQTLPAVSVSSLRSRTAEIAPLPSPLCEKTLTDMKTFLEATMTRIDSRMQQLETRLHSLESKLHHTSDDFS